MGKTRFVLIFGVLGWGSLCYITSTYIVEPTTSYLFGADPTPPPRPFSPRFIAELLGGFVIWGTVGYVVGASYWRNIINRRD
jgi:hypothetical protein